MPTTSNFGWTTPADTDLVKDGASAIRTLGNGIDTSFIDLKGGTTGQILAKASNTDLDFSWIANDQGDITAVVAGTGISGGGTTGSVTITNDMATTITASGDIVVGTGNGTYDNLPIGTTGQVLTADTTVSPYKVKWATPAGGGKVLQVVSTSKTDTFSVASQTYTDITGLSVSITPSSTASKILIIAQIAVGTSTAGQAFLQLVRGSTAINIADAASTRTRTTFGSYTSDANVMQGASGVSFLDSPSTTSSTTYKFQMRASGSAQTVYINRSANDSDSDQANRAASTITVLEIGA